MRSLTLKLTLAFLLVGLIGSTLVAIILQRQTLYAFDQFILNREQQGLVNYLARYYTDRGSWEGVGALLKTIPDRLTRDFEPGSNRREGISLTLIGPDRLIIFSARPDQLRRRATTLELNRAIPLVVNGQQAGWLLLTPDARQWGPETPEWLFLRAVNRATFISAIIAGTLALVLGGVLAYGLTRTLRELTDATLAISSGKLGLQVKVRSKDELGNLATSFNKMSLDLERSTKSRQQMTADIAHDLRSPLSVISGYAEALSDGKLPGTPEVYDILHQETRHLSRLIEDLRLLSLADAGELQLDKIETTPKSLLEWVAARHAVHTQQKGVELRVLAEVDLPSILVDMERMAEVLDNLILNAFRYTDVGGIIILEARNADGRTVIQVRDNGTGIAADDMPHIFDRFYRADRSRQQNGESGLGLAIARSIVEAHGGTISASSEIGKGTVISILI